nr:DNA methyltransferase [Helicobacter cetorum]
MHDFTLERSQESIKRYTNPDNDERGAWQSSDISVGPAVECNIYPIFNPYTKQEICPPHGYSWRFSQEKSQELIADNRIAFPKSGNGVPRYKRFLSEVKQGVTPMSLWTYQEVGHTQDAMREIKELFNNQALFDTPKPEKLIKRIVEISTQENDLVLDFFAGSGTTACVAHKLNRKHIGIEMGEHFECVVLPRIKKVIGGLIKVYELESYEEILRNIEIKGTKLNFKAPFLCDKLLGYVLKTNENDEFELDLNELEKRLQLNATILETLFVNTD